MRRKVLVAVLVVASGAAVGWRWRAAPIPVLQLAGTLEAREVRVGSLVGGRVQAVHVEEGAEVRAGQPVVTLAADLLDPQIREQEGRLREARARFDLQRAGPRPEEIARARAEWEWTESERRRMEALATEGIVGRQAYDAAAVLATTRRERLRELEQGSRAEDVAAAAAVVEREQARLAWLRGQRAETVVRAPAAGLVRVIDLRPGDIVVASQPVASLLEPDQMWARVWVPETRLGLVHVGDRVQLAVDSHPGRRFPGRVTEIATRAEYTPRNVQTLEQRADQVFGVKVTVEPAPELKPGMAVVATLAVR